ncbi:hypothetical protein BpHYR1_007315 [Brachionus plicatilis]|uniref:Uncharacterized protein n=1 Tax=Brachionus plicatilis TaxID=10195 RepID=A0A3M7RBJ7_BRAPC|nr:hypothetical protein BpHYR1_007315 [Brachionus plicatilis]
MVNLFSITPDQTIVPRKKTRRETRIDPTPALIINVYLREVFQLDAVNIFKRLGRSCTLHGSAIELRQPVHVPVQRPAPAGDAEKEDPEYVDVADET